MNLKLPFVFAIVSDYNISECGAEKRKFNFAAINSGNLHLPKGDFAHRKRKNVPGTSAESLGLDANWHG